MSEVKPPRAARRRRVIFAGKSTWKIGRDGRYAGGERAAWRGLQRWAIFQDDKRVARRPSEDSAAALARAMAAATERPPLSAARHVVVREWPHHCANCGCPYAASERGAACHICRTRPAQEDYILPRYPRSGPQATLMKGAIREYFERVHEGQKNTGTRGGLYTWEVEMWERVLEDKLAFYRGSRALPFAVLRMWRKALRGEPID